VNKTPILSVTMAALLYYIVHDTRTPVHGLMCSQCVVRTPVHGLTCSQSVVRTPVHGWTCSQCVVRSQPIVSSECVVCLSTSHIVYLDFTVCFNRLLPTTVVVQVEQLVQCVCVSPCLQAITFITFDLGIRPHLDQGQKSVTDSRSRDGKVFFGNGCTLGYV